MISFDSGVRPFQPANGLKIKSWLIKVIEAERKKTGNIHYTFLSDEELLVMNQQYLNHNYFTDIITFPLSASDDIISGEIFISIDRVADNAKQNSVDFNNELFRVLVHGILHLIGYDDHSDEEKAVMREKENLYLKLIEKNISRETL
jgi:rRNA maturation RNase YbeY